MYEQTKSKNIKTKTLRKKNSKKISSSESINLKSKSSPNQLHQKYKPIQNKRLRKHHELLRNNQQYYLQYTFNEQLRQKFASFCGNYISEKQLDVYLSTFGYDNEQILEIKSIVKEKNHKQSENIKLFGIATVVEICQNRIPTLYGYSKSIFTKWKNPQTQTIERSDFKRVLERIGRRTKQPLFEKNELSDIINYCAQFGAVDEDNLRKLMIRSVDPLLSVINNKDDMSD